MQSVFYRKMGNKESGIFIFQNFIENIIWQHKIIDSRLEFKAMNFVFRIRPSTEAAFNYAMDGLFSAVTKENVPDRTMTSKRGSPPMHHNQRRQSDEDLRSKRRRDESWTHHREKSPNGHAPGNGDGYNKPRDRDKDRRDRYKNLYSFQGISFNGPHGHFEKYMIYAMRFIRVNFTNLNS